MVEERRNSRGGREQEEIARGRPLMTTVCSVDIRRPANFAGLMPGEKKKKKKKKLACPMPEEKKIYQTYHEVIRAEVL